MRRDFVTFRCDKSHPNLIEKYRCNTGSFRQPVRIDIFVPPFTESYSDVTGKYNYSIDIFRQLVRPRIDIFHFRKVHQEATGKYRYNIGIFSPADVTSRRYFHSSVYTRVIADVTEKYRWNTDIPCFGARPRFVLLRVNARRDTAWHWFEFIVRPTA